MNYINGEITLNIGFLSESKRSELEQLLIHAATGDLKLIVAGEEVSIDINEVVSVDIKAFDYQTEEEIYEDDLVY
ncbi:hypothetical protein MKX78_10895 [Cytobacillus sp. FSL R5-0569]|uniref:hypothetical protein n=1 Tax=Cytobacillus sp. FSL R5-0569 TaxID=2921649 RepID=UPI0030FD05E1